MNEAERALLLAIANILYGLHPDLVPLIKDAIGGPDDPAPAAADGGNDQGGTGDQS